MKDREKNKTAGVTLLEFLVVMAVLGVVLGAIYGVFVSQRDAYDVEDQRVEMEQNARAATNMIMRELRMAGYHALDPEFVNNLDVWVPGDWIPTEPSEVNLDDNPKVTLGPGTEPDMITFLAVLESDHNPTTMTAGAAEGDTTISVNDSADIEVGDMLHIGSTSDYAKVRGVGNVLTIDTDPTLIGNQGLSQAYPAGTEVGEIFLVTYTVFNETNDGPHVYHDEGHPFLMRKQNGDSYAAIAENITDLQISTTAGVGGVELNLSAQPEKAGAGYGMAADAPSLAVAARIDIRNVGHVSLGSDCPLPAAPTGVNAEGLDETYPCQVHVTWAEVTTDENGAPLEEGCQVTGYKIYFDTDVGIMANGVFVGDTTDVVGDVQDYESCTMYAQIAAQNMGGYGDRSSIVTVVDTTAPAQPQNLTATNAVGEQQIGLAWNMGTDCDLDGYHVLRADAGTLDYTRMNRVILRDVAHYTDWEVIGCKPYDYRVIAVDYCPEGPSSPSLPSAKAGPIAARDTTPPAPPYEVGATLLGSGVIRLDWSLSFDDGDGYHDVNKYYIYCTGTWIGEEDAGSTSHDVAPALQCGGTYEVSAVDLCGNESDRAAVGASTSSTSSSTTTTTTTTTTTEPNEPQPPDIENITQDPDGPVVPLNTDVEICADISDYSGIASALLHSNWDGDLTMTAVSVDEDGNGHYCATIPNHNNRTITYYIIATDGIGLEGISDPAYYEQDNLR